MHFVSCQILSIYRKESKQSVLPRTSCLSYNFLVKQVFLHFMTLVTNEVMSHLMQPHSSYSPTMIKYGLHNIRDFVGAEVNLQRVRDSPLCQLEK
jgi:hypothetical protein